MTSLQVVLVMAGAPLVITVLIGSLTMRPNLRRAVRARRGRT